MSSAFVYAAVRTPFGRFGGALAEVRPDDLAATVLTGVLGAGAGPRPGRDRRRGVGQRQRGRRGQPQRRPDGRPAGRAAGLGAGAPRSTGSAAPPSTPRSSASRTIETGDADVVLVGGVESMTRAPWVLPKPSRAFPAGNVTAVSTTLGWRLVNERMPAEWTVSLGEANEQLAERFAHLAGAAGRVRRPLPPPRRRGLGRRASTTTWWSPVPGVDLARDEGIRPGSDRARSSPGSSRRSARDRHHHRRQRLAAQRRRLRACCSAPRRPPTAIGPSTRWPGSPAAARAPSSRRLFGFAPVEAAEPGARPGRHRLGRRRRRRAQRGVRRRSRWPASTPGEVDPEIVNAEGGAIAIGHPLGASGGRILGTLAARLRESGERWGVAAICIGVGQGLAVVLENVA